MVRPTDNVKFHGITPFYCTVLLLFMHLRKPQEPLDRSPASLAMEHLFEPREYLSKAIRGASFSAYFYTGVSY